VWSTVRVSIGHIQGFADIVWIFLAESPTDCTLDSNTTVHRWMPPEPTQDFFLTTAVMHPFTVSAAGTYTYHLTAIMVQSGGASSFFEASSIVVVYYPT